MDFSQIIKILLFYKKKILLFTLSTIVLVFLILYFIFPIKYTAEVVLLPPDEQNVSGLQALMGGSDVTSFLGFGGGLGSAQLFAEVLKSRTAGEIVVKNCSLLPYFDEESVSKSVEKLQKLINIEVTKERLIKFNVTLSTSFFCRYSSEKDSIKILSARVANSFTNALDKINQDKLRLKATNLMNFFKGEIEAVTQQLKLDEEVLQLFEEENKTISIPEQLSATLETAAKIKSEILFTEIELQTLEHNLRDNNSKIESLKKRLEVLKDTYKGIEGIKGLDNTDYLPEFEDIPMLSLQFARLKRNVKVSNELYLLLQKQYFKEQIQANRNVPTVEVLDPAIPPLKASSPRVVFSSLLGGIVAFFLISSFILFLEKKKIEK